MGKILAVFLVCIIFFTGCELDKTSEENETTTTEVTEPELLPFPIYISDIKINSSPERVICLTPSLAEIIFELGYGEKIIGRGSYCDYPPIIMNITDIGSSANPKIDEIISLEPEIILTSTPIADKDLFVMEQAGIKTLVFPAPTDLNRLKEIYQAISLIFNGAFTGAETGEEAFAPISKACNNSDVVYIGDFVYITEGFGIATGDTLESAVFSCFGNNLAAEGERYEFDKTLLLEKEPQIILLNSKYSAEDLKSDEIFSQLSAVNDGKIIYIENIFFERPTNRIVNIVEKLLMDFKNGFTEQ